MGTRGFFHFVGMCMLFLFLPGTCLASVRKTGKINPGFQGSEMQWIDNDGIFLVSNNSNFGFGFTTTAQDVTLFLVAIKHMRSDTVVWSANRASPIRNSDAFVFDDTGNVYLRSGEATIWSTDTGKKGVSAMELLDSGNLILVRSDGTVVWQSFSHPTDTLLSNQNFTEGMKLESNPNSNNLSYVLEIKSGSMVLYAGFPNPQPYWSMAKDNRRIINKDGGDVTLASINANSWRFYDKNRVFLWQFIFSDDSNTNATWIAVLQSDGFISFNNLQDGSNIPSQTKIPSDPCSRPEACDPYLVCYSGGRCQCPSILNPPNCTPNIASPCNKSAGSFQLVNAGDGLRYFALGFVPPSSKTDLNGCKASCLGNCSCLAMFFERNSGNCYLFDQLGSLQGSNSNSGYASYIKVASSGSTGGNSVGSGSGSKHIPIIIIIIVVVTVLVIIGLLYAGALYYKKTHKRLPESPKESSEEDNFLEGLQGMPIRFSYSELQTATNNFSVILGRGGFGSVYQGILPDGTRLAVKKLESIGQGKKEFRAEVSIIGSIHHLHLVRLRGFCAEGTHRLLAYEFMANGSLDTWLFRRNKEKVMLDWDTRYNIAVGTAKGLAYLHEDCDVKIIHCDIKPENVLLDDHFSAKVSDFGLAKLMTREQSHVFTTLRGTRGYLAPEWITNYAISEKSDVYSYGMVLLEIIGGRKNYDPAESSEKCHFPSYAFKMMEEGKLKDILDSTLQINEADERVGTAIKVALWCIQDDMYLRPPMTKVVQMLEGICTVPPLPASSQMNYKLYSSFFKSFSEDGTGTGTGSGTGTSSGPSDYNSDAYLSAVQLSGPR